MTTETWTDAIGLEELAAKGRAVVRRGGLQVLLIKSERGLFAIPNRCPHEGYPLSEGAVTGGCVLTCNWHNWKFDLASGETLYGGDRVRRFPVKIEAGRVLLDLTPEDPAARRARAMTGLLSALADEDQDRLVRETARLLRLGADPAEPVTAAIAWAAERHEFGTQHAIGAAPDWLTLYDRRALGPDRRLAAVGEILGHIADDGHRGVSFPYPPGERPWDATAYLAAVEAEDEPRAAALIRGALAGGLTGRDLLPTLVRAALAHYGDFGHSLIYSVKTVALIERLGPSSAEPLLLMLTRGFCIMTREDLLPEFRGYGPTLAAWGAKAATLPPLQASALTGTSAKRAMAVVGAWSGVHKPKAIFDVLVGAAAWMLLHADEDLFFSTDGKLADNINWLDFTHALTFAEAGRTAVKAAPELWPALLLQLACFIGRNGGYVDKDLDIDPFEVADPRAFAAEATERLFDHGADRFIVSAHYAKTLLAGLDLAKAVPAAAPAIYAALNRFLGARIKRRHVLRTARQMRVFVAQE